MKRRTTHLIERDESLITIKGCVLEPLCHDGPAVLLQPHHTVQRSLAAETASRLPHGATEQSLEKIEHARIAFHVASARMRECPLNVTPIGVADGAFGINVSAVHRTAGDQFLERVA